MSDPKEVKLTSAGRRSIILRALRLNEQADKGYTLRILLKEILQVVGEYLMILLMWTIVDGVTSWHDLHDLLIPTAVSAGLGVATQLTMHFVARRESSHNAKHDMRLRSMMTDKIMNMDYVHLEGSDMQNRYNMCMNYLFGWHGISSVPIVVGNMAVDMFRIIIGAALIIPSVIHSSGKSGFAGFITSPLGFLSAIVIVTVSELIKNLYFNRKTYNAYEEVRRDKRHLLYNRTYSAYVNYVVSNYRSGKEIRLYSEQELILGEMERCAKDDYKLWLKAFSSVINMG